MTARHPRGTRVTLAHPLPRGRWPSSCVDRAVIRSCTSDSDVGTVIGHRGRSCVLVAWDELADEAFCDSDGMPGVWCWVLPSWALVDVTR